MNTPTENTFDTYQSILAAFSDFLVVSIHTILHQRSIYPPNTFMSTRKYNFPVRQNRHPKVCQWIIDAVAAVETELVKGTVAQVAIVIYSPTAEVLERFMFDVSSFPEMPEMPETPLDEVLTPLEDDEDSVCEEDIEIDIEFIALMVEIEEQLRGAVSKLAYCGGKLGPLPSGCTYTVAVELKEKASLPIGHLQPWAPCVPSLQRSEKEESTRIGRDLGGVKTVPVRSIEAGPFILEMWIEEGKAKQGIVK